MRFSESCGNIQYNFSFRKKYSCFDLPFIMILCWVFKIFIDKSSQISTLLFEFRIIFKFSWKLKLILSILISLNISFYFLFLFLSILDIEFSKLKCSFWSIHCCPKLLHSSIIYFSSFVSIEGIKYCSCSLLIFQMLELCSLCSVPKVL